MPKRIVDGDGLWRSDKLSQVEPASFRAELANLIPLALANGSFECNPRLIWSRCYAYNRPDVTLEMVEKILAEFERVGILIRWEAGTKTWGYWVGIEKTGRLPSSSRQQKKHEAIGPTPPTHLLTGQPMASHSLTNGEAGSGIGSGSGIGKGNGLGVGCEGNDKLNGKTKTFPISEKATAKSKAKPKATPTLDLKPFKPLEQWTDEEFEARKLEIKKQAEQLMASKGMQ